MAEMGGRDGGNRHAPTLTELKTSYPLAGVDSSGLSHLKIELPCTGIFGAIGAQGPRNLGRPTSMHGGEGSTDAYSPASRTVLHWSGEPDNETVQIVGRGRVPLKELKGSDLGALVETA